MINLDEFKKGKEVSLGKITKVYGTAKNFVLYETDKLGNVIYEIDTEHIDPCCVNDIKTHITEIQSLLATKQERRKFSIRIAMVYADCFLSNSEAGKKILENLIPSIKKYKQLKSRLFYMISAMLSVVVNMVLCLLLNDLWINTINQYVILLFTVATFGSMGGLISILTKIPKLELDIAGSNFLQIIDGFSRIFLSMISSIMIFILIKSGIVLGTFSKIENNNIFYALGIVSGFSEMFIPGIIRSIEKKQLEEDKK